MRRREFFAGCSGLAAAAFPRCSATLAEFRDRVGLASSDFDWESLRQELRLDPAITYLNTGSAGCTPKFMLDELGRTASELEQNPFEHLWREGLVRRVEQVRVQMYTYWNAGPDELALTENATSGIAAIAAGIDWAPHDEVVLSTHEHLSCQAIWKHYAKRYGLTLRYVELPVPEYWDEEFIGRLEAQLSDKTRLVCLSQVDSYLGIRLPIERLGPRLRPRNVLLVCDAAQSLGMFPLDFSALDVDALVGSGHKWLMGPKSLGLLYIRRAAQQQIRPALVDWSFAAVTPCTGTRNLAQLMAWQSVIDLQKLLGGDRVAARIQDLRRRLTERLAEETRLRPLLQGDEAPRATGLSAFTLPAASRSADVAARLATEFQVEVKPLPPTCELEPERQCDYNALRISTHVYNNEQDLDRLIGALKGVGL